LYTNSTHAQSATPENDFAIIPESKTDKEGAAEIVEKIGKDG
jgi:hypothetical protein